MVANISFNPMQTTVAAGSFNTETTGYIQGTALNDPAVRNELAGGVLATAETIPMWGGCGVYELIPTQGARDALGGTLGRATALTGATGLIGFSVFDQDHSMINTPQSPVPLAASLMGVNFYRLGSNARIAVAIDPVLATLEGDIINSQVSWDFVNQRIVPYNAAYAANVITAASWASTGGGQITYTTTTAHGVGVGIDIQISGFTPDGYNGSFTTLAGTTGSTIVVAKAADPGSDTVQGQLDAGGGALNVRVLDVQIGNSMTVSYDPDTGFATWNRSGSTAIILI